LNHGLHVVFDNEPAEDFSGVTKDMFSSFWKAIREKYMRENYYQFVLLPENLPLKKELKAYGLILEHGFKLTRYIPNSLNPAQLFMILTSEIPSDEIILKSFLGCLSMYDANCLREALTKDFFDETFKETLMNLLASYEIKGLTQPGNFVHFLQDLARIEIIMKPYFVLVHIARKIWPANELIFQRRLKVLKPDGKKLLNAL